MDAKRIIKKVAVLGSGVMGSRIACHFANIGVQVLLFDIVPENAAEGNKAARNKIVNDALDFAIKSNPSPLYLKSFARRITTGNFTDDISKISDCDWIIEVVVERLDIKQKVFESVEKYRKPGTLITSNTSGIPIHLMAEGRSDDFKKNFCGSHFFNPPRYLKLLEIIPTKDTLPGVVNFLMDYGDKFLGKTTVLAKDTPAFIGNRIGVFSIMSLLHYVNKTGLTVEEVDKLTGPVIGHPKSATFRTNDVVGLDTMVHVANGLFKNAPDDEANELFEIPGFVKDMVKNNWLGSKTGQGFYKKEKVDGVNQFYALDLKSLDYKPSQKVKFAALEATKAVEKLEDRLKILFAAKDKAGDFYRATFYQLFAYSSKRIPEIADEFFKIDAAMNAGFGWEMGPFEKWDALGVENTLKDMEASANKPAQWVYEMLETGAKSFYKVEDGKRMYYDIASRGYKVIPGTENYILLKNLGKDKIIWKNSGTTITDIGDGILNLEFHTKMNTIGGEVIEGINKAIMLAEANYKGLVISNEGANFSAGANVGMIFMMAVDQEFDELNMVVKTFQNAMMRLRYSSIPVVAAPHQMALGGGCEICLHADKVVAHAELYMGLVEFGVGLIPGGGGTKEFAVRLSDELQEGDIELNNFRERFLTIGQAKVSTSAYEAFEYGYLKKGRDVVVVSQNRLLAEAKQHCLQLANEGYVQPLQRTDIKVLGKQALGLAYVGANTMYSGNYISEHDVKISQKLGFVLSGGDLSQPSLVSESYLLDLEREAFLALCTEKKTLERIQSILTGGKVLRN
ncbi:3-hydroxyacyl-CoA dehydrogenase/enoyl-CoA hydratase family protein [Mucilaginibacter flavidus]|uniref:3-hydroxyacyl-CoA dehydrogenase/enoyl-CoA hydratase family protein n=1 Tax=Mucilaginibacter flavidus TaxID=2949309 RepID=UPI002093AD88|nr:3-hydroxyacyl-CoA dehydrogenase/enoyl-CoA hydratase family protein [Mucilaginibacter flavidus]MCO5948233.1 3-hydroxyacyl-CoA dehydrogenase NAD-binding domain-containing protein [Mucilaginibacter flavidus]